MKWRWVRATGAGALALAASACGGGISSTERFPPACPRPALLREGSDLTRYRGNGRDFLDTSLQGRITAINGSCTQDGSQTVVATVQVGLELSRGPAARSRQVSVPFFVAVSQGQRVLDKQIYTVNAEFPENTDRLRLVGDSVTLRLPVSKDMKADTYQVTAGFQLTPAELAANRREAPR